MRFSHFALIAVCAVISAVLSCRGCCRETTAGLDRTSEPGLCRGAGAALTVAAAAVSRSVLIKEVVKQILRVVAAVVVISALALIGMGRGGAVGGGAGALGGGAPGHLQRHALTAAVDGEGGGITGGVALLGL